MLMQYDTPNSYVRKAQEYLVLYPDDYLVIGRVGEIQWHHLNDFSKAEIWYRRAMRPQYERTGLAHYRVGIALLGQERVDEALVEFARSRHEDRESTRLNSSH